MCSVRISEPTWTFALYNINRLFFITEVEGVYCAVRNEYFYKTDMFCLKRVNPHSNKGSQGNLDSQKAFAPCSGKGLKFAPQ
jgi:hypothetical protein